MNVISYQTEPVNAISISLGAFFEQVIELETVFLGKKDVFSAVSSYQGVIHPTGHMHSGFPCHKEILGHDSKKSMTPFLDRAIESPEKIW